MGRGGGERGVGSGAGLAAASGGAPGGTMRSFGASCFGSRQLRRKTFGNKMTVIIETVRQRHRQPRDVGAWAERTTCWETEDTRLRLRATHRDSPPEDVRSITAGLLARGSPRLTGLPRAFAHQ